MSNIGELVERLVSQGVPVGEASEIIALAVAAGAATYPHRKTGAAIRQKAYRDRLKGITKHNETITPLHETGHNESITNHNESITRYDASLSKNNKIDRKRGRATQLPDGWRPSEAAWRRAVERVGEQRAEIELVKLRNHAADKGRTSKNWDAAWDNWIGKALDFGGIPPPPSLVATPKMTEEEAVSHLARTGRWSRYSPCPEPGHIGNDIPPEVYAKYGLLPDGRKAA